MWTSTISPPRRPRPNHLALRCIRKTSRSEITAASASSPIRPAPCSACGIRRKAERRRGCGDVAPFVARHTGAALICLLALLHRQVRARSPFRPGAVIERLRLLAERVEGEPQHRGGDTGTAGGDDRFAKIDAGFGENLLQPVRRQQPTILDQGCGGY